MGEAKRKRDLKIVVHPDVAKDMKLDVAEAIGALASRRANALVVEISGRVFREITSTSVRLKHCPTVVTKPHDMDILQQVMVNADYIGEKAVNALTAEFDKRGISWFMKPAESDAS